MTNMFFVWKDPNCNGVNPEWIQMTGTEFHEFITRPENKKRKIIKEYVDPDNKRLGFYRFEVTPEEYRKWDAKRKRDLRARQNDMLNLPRISAAEDDECSTQEEYGIIDNSEDDDCLLSDDEYADYQDEEAETDEIDDEEECQVVPFVVSLDEIAYVEELLSFHDVIADPDVNVEEDAIKRVLILQVLKFVEKLPDDERKIIKAIYLENPNRTSDRELSKQFGISKSEFNRKKLKILKKLRRKLGQQ